MINDNYNKDTNTLQILQSDYISPNTSPERRKPKHNHKSKEKVKLRDASKLIANNVSINAFRQMNDKEDPENKFYEGFLAFIEDNKKQEKFFTPKPPKRIIHKSTMSCNSNGSTPSVNASSSLSPSAKSFYTVDKEFKNTKKITASCFKNQSSTPAIQKRKKTTVSIINYDNSISPKKVEFADNEYVLPASTGFILKYCGLNNKTEQSIPYNDPIKEKAHKDSEDYNKRKRQYERKDSRDSPSSFLRSKNSSSGGGSKRPNTNPHSNPIPATYLSKDEEMKKEDNNNPDDNGNKIELIPFHKSQKELPHVPIPTSVISKTQTKQMNLKTQPKESKRFWLCCIPVSSS